MAFPNWTLWGMGISALGALLAIGIALLAQSPTLLRRLNLDGARLDLRVKSFTGYGFALMLLALGFFLAGVPLEGDANQPVAQVTVVVTATVGTELGEQEIVPPTFTLTPRSANAGTSDSGAFPAPLPRSTTPASESIPSTPTSTQLSPAATSSQQPTATSTPTLTSTPTPTVTPTPTLTPTPIEGQTATINAGSATTWLRRTPGGALLVSVSNRSQLIVLNRHASQGGIAWQEVSTLDGLIGWIRTEYLVFEE